MDTHPVIPSKLRRFAWGLLAYNLAVVAWGAFVRATGSGAGCGRHWPLCDGQVVPRPKDVAMLIEATHRATSGIALLGVVGLCVWVFRTVPKGHPARKNAALTTVFMFGEAALGAGLVLFELVAHDASMKRGLSMILHLGNTFFLLAALTATAHSLGPNAAPARRSGDSIAKTFLCLAMGAILVLASSGAIAALGDTLFPARTLGEAIRQDISPMAHAFLRLRVLHPFLALFTGVLVVCAASVVRVRVPNLRVRKLSFVVTGLFVVQFAAGVLNVTLLAPVWMQLVHLLLADLTWIALVLLTIETAMASAPERAGTEVGLPEVAIP